ncbi:TPA: hypothetical protein DEF17_09455 [bacterium]|nr:hypothetical protein [bacterium]
MLSSFRQNSFSKNKISVIFFQLKQFISKYDTELLISIAVSAGIAVAVLIYIYAPWQRANSNSQMVLDVEMTNRKLSKDPLDHATRLELARYYLQWGLAVSKNELPDDISSDSELKDYFEKKLSEWEKLGEDVAKLRSVLNKDLTGFRRRFFSEEQNLARGMFEQSVLLFRQAKALGANFSARDLYDLGTAYYQLGPEGYSGAVKYLNQAVANGLVSARALTFLGNVSVARGDIDGGISMYRRALDYAPDDPILAFNLAIAYKEHGQYAPAVEFFIATLRLYQDKENLVEEELSIILQTRLALGWCLLKLSKPQEAIEHFETLLDDQPDLTEAHYWLGVAYGTIGKIDPAKAHLQRTLKLSPGYRDAVDRLNQLNQISRQGAVIRGRVR